MEPTIAQMIKKPIVYDRDRSKRLWEYYHGLGKASSHDKLLEFAQNEGMFNPRLGKPSNMGPTFAMWRYAFHNPKEAYEPWKKWVEENYEAIADKNIPINFDTFLKEIRKVVRHNYSPTKLRAWCEKWKVKYE